MEGNSLKEFNYKPKNAGEGPDISLSEEERNRLREINKQEEIDEKKWKQILDDLGQETYGKLEKLGFSLHQIQEVAGLLHDIGIIMVLRATYGLDSKRVGDKALDGGMNLMSFAQSIKPRNEAISVETQGQK